MIKNNLIFEKNISKLSQNLKTPETETWKVILMYCTFLNKSKTYLFNVKLIRKV